MTKFYCAPLGHSFPVAKGDAHNVVLYGYADNKKTTCSAGAAVAERIRKEKLAPATRAWDLLSIAISVVAADKAVARNTSPDGWTRQLELQVGVTDPVFWGTQKGLIQRQLRFLTTDIWTVEFFKANIPARSKGKIQIPNEDCVVLLSGGLDSLIGTVDLVAKKRKPFAVSQITRGDREKQAFFASKIGNGLRHLQLNHNAECPSESERSERARSIIFLAYGVLAATTLKRYREGDNVTLYVCENGFISVNPPLTDGRLGSLSTRTTHPVFMKLFQELLDAANLRVKVENPYQFKTKGEMLTECADQAFLRTHAHKTTSCGRFARNNYKHCGRCTPCLIRRAAFNRWKLPDRTTYVYSKLSRKDRNHARFDDVRSVAIAVAEVKTNGLNDWLGTSLSSTLLGDVSAYKETVGRGLDELKQFLDLAGVK